MKTMKIVVLAVITMVMASCGSSKQAAQAPVQQQGNGGFGQDVSMPCTDASYDDSENFKALGMGTNMNPQNARAAAFDAAQSMFYKRLGGFVQGIASDYSRTMAGTGEKTQRAMEATMDKIVEQMVNDAQKTCERMTQTDAGVYNAFIAIQIPKGKMVTDMANALSKNEELEIEFNRDQFRQYAEDKMAKMKASQKANK